MSDKNPPSPEAIRGARESAGLTKAQAAEMVHAHERSWRYWEAGSIRMPVGLWELFTIKVAQRAEDRA